jgi:hypothetical protein
VGIPLLCIGVSALGLLSFLSEAFNTRQWLDPQLPRHSCMSIVMERAAAREKIT